MINQNMNMTQLISRIKKKIGLNGVLKGIYHDKVLRDIILSITLPEWNNWSSFKTFINTDYLLNFMVPANFYSPGGDYHRDIGPYGQAGATAELQRMLPTASTEYFFRLPAFFMRDLEKHGSRIVNVDHKKITTKRYFYENGIRMDLMGLSLSQNRRANSRPPSFKFRAPDTIYIENYYPYYTSLLAGMKIFIYVTHPNSLATITAGLASKFEELATLDVMMYIYNNDMRLLNIDLGNSRVEVSQLENFQNAENNRKELLQEIAKRSIADRVSVSAF